MRSDLRAFTLVELIVVMAIVAIVAAISSPVLSAAIHSAHVQQSISNLHQIHIALATYRSDHDGDGRYGDLGDTGLPPGRQLSLDLHDLGTPVDLWRSPCGVHPDMPESIHHYQYWPGDGGDPFASWCLAFRENMVVLTDSYCTPHDVPLGNVYQSRRGIGLLLSGQVVNRYKPGPMTDPAWWSDPAP
jgi:prepilin-type N-terminal cleavage/methylation domain-containing protein